MASPFHSLVDVIQAFRFQAGVTPLSTLSSPTCIVIGYVALTHSLQHYFRNRDAANPLKIIIIHNVFLSVLSLMLSLSLSIAVIESFIRSKSVHYLLCAPEMHDNGILQFLYYINYLTKFYELLDTIFLVIRKKEVLFLHEYHHAATALLCWSQLTYYSTVQWVPILLNLMVHSVMYWYYALTAMGIKQIWWKKHVTTLQIVQFVLDLIACSYAWGTRALFHNCHGEHIGALIGVSILFSYLILFVIFYINTYKGSKSSRKDQGQQSKDAIKED